MMPFGRIGMPGPRIVLALDHPNFGKNSLSDIQGAYAERIAPSAEPGVDVILCDPQHNSLRKLELVEHLSASKVKLGVRGMIIPGQVEWSYEDASHADCFGGWPCVALVPTTPCRLLRLDVRTMWPDAVQQLQVRAASFLDGAAGYAPDVQFLRFGVPVDNEATTLLQLGQWAEAGEQLEVRIGLSSGDVVRVPVRFGATYAREGQRAARQTLEDRQGAATSEMTDVAIIFVGLAAIIGAVVYVLRSRVHWELDGLRKDLSSDGMSATERDTKAARWDELQRRLHSSSQGKGGTKTVVDYASFEPVPKPPHQ